MISNSQAIGSTLIALSLMTTVSATAADRVPMLDSAPGMPMRITINHWPTNGWVVQAYKSNVELKFPGETVSIDVGPTLLDQMEGYLSDVSVETGEDATYLRLTLSCECVPAVSGDGQGSLNIDLVENPRSGSSSARVASGPAPWSAPLPLTKSGTIPDVVETANGEINVDEARERLIAQLLRAADAGLVEMQPDPSALPGQADLSGDDTTEGPTPPPTLSSETPSSVSQPGAAASDPDPQPDMAIAEEIPEEELLERVSNAAASGDDILSSLMEPSENQTDQSLASSRDGSAPSDRMANAVSEPDDAQPGNTPSAPQDTDETSLGGVAKVEPACFENEMFDFSDVPDQAELFPAIMAERQHLIGEFDRPDVDRALNLAKLYILAGATIEARRVLEAFVPDHPTSAIYYELSVLRDGGALASDASILKPDCVGEQALWRAVAQAMLGQGKEAVQSESIAGRALERLPLELREEAAAWIGDAAAEVGDWDGARRMEAVVNRAATSLPGRSGRAHLMSAKLAFWNGERDLGVEHLQRATSKDPRSATDALFALADLALNDPKLHGANTKSLQADLGALARLLGDTEDGRRAFEMEVKLANRAQPQTASMAMLNHGVATGLVEEDRQFELLTDVITDPNGDDEAEPLAMTYLADPERFHPALQQPGFRKELARSMIALSVPKRATEVMQDADYEDAALAMSLAEALVSTGADREAMEVIAKLPDGPEKSKLLGDSFLSRGQPEQAVSHLDRAVADLSNEDQAIAALESKAIAAQQAGDLGTALSAHETIFQKAPSLERARRIAILAMTDGRAELPQSVSQYLAAEAPDMLEDLAPLFADADGGPDLASPESVNSYLEALDAEERAIQELLDNG